MFAVADVTNVALCKHCFNNQWPTSFNWLSNKGTRDILYFTSAVCFYARRYFFPICVLLCISCTSQLVPIFRVLSICNCFAIEFSSTECQKCFWFAHVRPVTEITSVLFQCGFIPSMWCTALFLAYSLKG